MTGIYGIHNLINDKWYVGQAIDIDLRWKRHIWALNNDYHYNPHLLRSWKKYGASSFQFVVLEECDSGSLNDREIFWIKQLHALTEGYNQCEGGNSTNGYKWSEDAKLKFAEQRSGTNNPFYGKHHSIECRTAISNRQLGEKNKMFGRFGKDNPRSKKVQCIETGIVYYGISEAERQTGINRYNISSCCAGRLKSAGKLHWKYVM